MNEEGKPAPRTIRLEVHVMPSPFPGMDPYLEDPGLWQDVHHEFASVASEFLNTQLRPKYRSRIHERVYLSDDDDPGRTVWTTQDWTPGAPPEPIRLLDEEIHEAYLSIIDCKDYNIVTVIEVLRPVTKILGSRGRASFETSRSKVLGSPSHWVEIDLLRGGVGVWTREALPPCEYLVHLSRVEKRPKGLLWPIRLSQRLPVIMIPLKTGDPDASLDLQAVLNTAYDRAGYDLDLDYTRDPTPPLSGEWSAWADRLLKARGIRPA
jgi:hypothetical protein